MEQVKDLNNKRVLDISEDRKTAEIRRGDCVTRIRAKPDGTLTQEVMNDLLHPNEKGYQIWWDAMRPVFKEICGK